MLHGGLNCFMAARRPEFLQGGLNSFMAASIASWRHEWLHGGLKFFMAASHASWRPQFLIWKKNVFFWAGFHFLDFWPRFLGPFSGPENGRKKGTCTVSVPVLRPFSGPENGPQIGTTLESPTGAWTFAGQRDVQGGSSHGNQKHDYLYRHEICLCILLSVLILCLATCYSRPALLKDVSLYARVVTSLFIFVCTACLIRSSEQYISEITCIAAGGNL